MPVERDETFHLQPRVRRLAAAIAKMSDASWRARNRRKITDHLPYSFQVRLLQRGLRRRQARIVRQIEGLRAKQDWAGITDAQNDAWLCDQDYGGEILIIQSRRLIEQLQRYSLPLPEQSDWDEEQQPFYHRHLTRDAIARFRGFVRAEQKARFDDWAKWVPIATGATGLLGTLIGLLATWKM